MIEVVGVRFKPAGKIYYFSTANLELNVHDHVIVETARGVEYGQCVLGPRMVSEKELVQPLKPVIRKATPEDELIVSANRQKEREAFDICLKKIAAHELPMKLIDVEYTFDGNKIIFSFTAEGRVDFRELVKDLAAVFRTRIELRQIGVRDEAKMLGGIGSCGRVLCCSTFLGDFEPVSIRMAKDQKLSLNPTKISGICGRLMCCLKYENGVYEEEKNSGDSSQENLLAVFEEELTEDDASLLKLLEEEDTNALKTSGGGNSRRGRNEGRHKKGEKNKGKSEKV